MQHSDKPNDIKHDKPQMNLVHGKEKYHKPALVKYGSVTQLTAGNPGSKMDITGPGSLE